MSDKPLISFVLPTWNRLEWVGEAVSSVLSQSEQNIELIIVDDGSTDGTWEFLNEWLKDNPKVKLVRNDVNMGAGPSRHKGAELASGDIICICDSDDVNTVDRAEETLKWFKENPESELVNFPYVSVGYNNDIIDRFDGDRFDHDLYAKEERVNYYCNPSVGMRKSSYFQTEGYKKETEKETDDNQFVRHWIKSGKKIDFCPGQTLLMHRVLPDSMMSKMRGFDAKWVEK